MSLVLNCLLCCGVHVAEPFLFRQKLLLNSRLGCSFRWCYCRPMCRIGYFRIGNNNIHLEDTLVLNWIGKHYRVLCRYIAAYVFRWDRTGRRTTWCMRLLQGVLRWLWMQLHERRARRRWGWQTLTFVTPLSLVWWWQFGDGHYHGEALTPAIKQETKTKSFQATNTKLEYVL